MREVTVKPRYQCDFCKYRSVKHVVAIHEKRCFRNPNRFCDACDNTKLVDACADVPGKLPCPYCEKMNPETLRSIEEREKLELAPNKPIKENEL